MSSLSLRSKLALMFIGVCSTTFAVGGYLVTSSAREALAAEVNQRLEFQARAYSTALDGHLQMLNRRIEDFASDGFIRSLCTDLISEIEDPGVLGIQLQEHLSANKLVLEPSFADLAVLGPEGTLIVTANGDPRWHPAPPSEIMGSSSNLFGGDTIDPAPTIEISTALHSLDRKRHIGRLVARVHTGVWIVDALNQGAVGDKPEHGRVELHLVDRAGRRLLVHHDLSSAARPQANSDLVLSGFGMTLSSPQTAHGVASHQDFRQTFPVASNGWTVVVDLPGDAIREAVAGLQARLMGIGLLLSLAACVSFLLPMSFVTRPLLKLQAAARELAAGKLSYRVELDTTDEMGELGTAFNTMASAVELREHQHSVAADALRRKQEQLAGERDRLQGVISSMYDGMVVLDSEGKVLIHNASAGPLLEALCKDDLHLVSRHTCSGATETPDACRKCLFAPEVESHSCVLELNGGTYEIHATQLASSLDGKSGRVIVSRDISDRVTEDERLIHQERLAVLGEIAAVMAHELNNPLAAISLHNQMLGSDLQGQEELLENVEVVQRNVDSCKKTIRALLDYATIAAPERASCDINAVLEDGSGFLRLLRERSNTSITMALTEFPLEVKMDEIQLRQIFVNLMVNAIQATQAEGGEIQVQSSLCNGYGVVDIRDNGCGIALDLQQKIFRPFFTTKARGEGTGLGLPTARRITEMHGGTLDLISSSSAGSHFRVRLLLENNPVA